MKKILNLTSLLFALLIAFSCDNDYDLPYNDYSSFSLYMSDGWDEGDKVLNIDNYIIYKDLSSNTIEHKWTIPSSAKFLNKEFTELDSVYTDFIIPGAGSVSNELQANVLFQEAGLNEVNLYNTYKDSVVGSVKVGDVWVLDSTFVIDVFANVSPACKVYKVIDKTTDPEQLELVATLTEDQYPDIKDQATWPQVSIEAGSELRYEDNSMSGRPTGRTWYADGGKPDQSNAEIADIKYNKLGDFTASMETKRSGDDVPNYSATKLIPLRINVIPSTQPFVQTGKINVEEGNVITLSVTGEVETLSGEEANFTVHVVNADAGFDGNIPVKTARLNSEDATVIELEIDGEIYNTDVVEVSYAGGNIVSVDSRVLEAFDPTSVVIPLGDSVLIESYASYETFKTAWKAAFCTGYWVGNTNGTAGAPYFARDENFFSNDGGSASMKYSAPSGLVKVNLQGTDFSKPNGYPAGKYRVSFMVYLEEGNTMKQFLTILKLPTPINTFWDIENLPRGEWVEVSQVLEVDEITSGTRLDLTIDPAHNAGVTGPQTIYFDNQKLIEIVPRP